MAKHGKTRGGRDLAKGTGSHLKKSSSQPKPIASSGGTEMTVPSPSAIRELGAASHLKAVREGMRNLEGNYRKRLGIELAKTYSTAVLLRADQDEWLSFCKEDEWRTFRNRPKDTDRDDALRFAIRFAVGFGSDEKSKDETKKRANKLLGALQGYFEQRVQPQEIPDRLEQDGGIEAIKALNVQNRKVQTLVEDAEVVTIQVPRSHIADQLLACQSPSEVAVILEIRSCDGHLIRANLRQVTSLTGKGEAPEPLVIPHLHGAGGTNSTKPAQRPHRLNKPTGKKHVKATAHRIMLKHELTAIQAKREQE